MLNLYLFIYLVHIYKYGYLFISGVEQSEMEDGLPKKSWLELKQVVCELRRQFSALSTVDPSSITFRNLSDGRTRIFFLSTPVNGWETTLLYADVNSDDHKVINCTLFRVIKVLSFSTTAQCEPWSPALIFSNASYPVPSQHNPSHPFFLG